MSLIYMYLYCILEYNLVCDLPLNTSLNSPGGAFFTKFEAMRTYYKVIVITLTSMKYIVQTKTNFKTITINGKNCIRRVLTNVHVHCV